MNETMAWDRPFDFSQVHAPQGAIQHRDGHGALECQCGRGMVFDSTAEANVRWGRHLAEAGQS